MKRKSLILLIATSSILGCSKSATPAPSAGTMASPSSVPTRPAVKSNDAVQQKLLEFAGGSGADCGRLDVQAPAPQVTSAGSCAMDAAQGKHPFYVAYDMPGMSIGIAGNSDGKLFTVQSQGADNGLTSGACPSAIRIASSGRVTCFAPGDMGSMGSGHQGGMPTAKMPNPHGGGDKKQK